MELIKTNCSSCGRQLEFPSDFDSVVCSNCGSSFIVRDYKGTKGLSLSAQKRGELGSSESSETLADIDERIATVASEIEATRSSEQSAPLQMGCSVFGLFSLAIVVIAVFMTVGAKYFGRWPFYLALAVVVVFGLFRMRRKLMSPDDVQALRKRREELETELSGLESERNRLTSPAGLNDSTAAGSQTQAPTE